MADRDATHRPAPDDADRQRVRRVEEAAAHTDYRVDQLDGQLRELFDRVRALAARLERLEGTLKKIDDAQHEEPPAD